ncbi:MAG: hypothetical protein HON90_17510 [Halobacteriovoraceae bacterium]|jgi:hypothetical protein|nr:hypothetical protein [Halobacteriovoraceae bacterium]
MAKQKILCLHSFLGSPQDYDFLKEKYDVIAPDLTQLVALDFEQLYQRLFECGYLSPEIPIIGYSFGSRLGSRLFNKMKQKPILVCLAGHLGIKSLTEKKIRNDFELDMMKRISESSSEVFLEFWNQLRLFANDNELNGIHYGNAALFFKNYGLSTQPFLKDKLLAHKEKCFFYYGLNDKKYCEYAKKELGDFDTVYLEHIGHRIISHHAVILSILGERI